MDEYEEYDEDYDSDYYDDDDSYDYSGNFSDDTASEKPSERENNYEYIDFPEENWDDDDDQYQGYLEVLRKLAEEKRRA